MGILYHIFLNISTKSCIFFYLCIHRKKSLRCRFRCQSYLSLSWDFFRVLCCLPCSCNCLIPFRTLSLSGGLGGRCFSLTCRSQSARLRLYCSTTVSDVFGRSKKMSKASKIKCLRLEGSNFRLGGIAPITRAVPSFLRSTSAFSSCALPFQLRSRKEIDFPHKVENNIHFLYPFPVHLFPAHGL